jgi:hypothetical protein
MVVYLFGGSNLGPVDISEFSGALTQEDKNFLATLPELPVMTQEQKNFLPLHIKKTGRLIPLKIMVDEINQILNIYRKKQQMYI